MPQDTYTINIISNVKNNDNKIKNIINVTCIIIGSETMSNVFSCGVY